MAIPEACGLWIEQRVQEELDSKGETGISLREIGRTISIEVEKYFETKVNPRAIEKRAERQSATNVATKSNIPINSNTSVISQHSKAVKPPSDSARGREIAKEKQSVTRPPSRRGGKRENAGRPKKYTFNETNKNIEWAKWSWNPVTGCKHGCPYCYAEQIANRFYPEKFEPTYRPERLTAPKHTRVPEHRISEPGINNVFVCSMADLFGEWVPNEWIQSVIDVCRSEKRWSYLFLTKNPKRYLDFDFPANCWLGATADTEKRLLSAQETFRLMNYGGVTFISCEPLCEAVTYVDYDALDFDDFSMFDWVIIGGFGESTPHSAKADLVWDWVEWVHFSARVSGCKIYWKPNLTIRPKEHPSC